MIREELLNEGKLVRHFSDDNKMILQVETGVEYSEAVDVVPCRYAYEETDIPIENTQDNATESDYLAALSKLGVNVNDEG